MGDLEARIGEVAWFSRLGRVSRWDDGCARIFAWDQWPGPETGPGEALALTSQDIHDRILAASPLDAGTLQATFDRLAAMVTERASTAVAFDPDADAWHGPTMCVHAAAYWAGLIGCVLVSGWPVPDDLIEVWAWLEAGHWPTSFAAEPGDGRDIFDDESRFPRRLLVY